MAGPSCLGTPDGTRFIPARKRREMGLSMSNGNSGIELKMQRPKGQFSARGRAVRGLRKSLRLVRRVEGCTGAHGEHAGAKFWASTINLQTWFGGCGFESLRSRQRSSDRLVSYCGIEGKPGLHAGHRVAWFSKFRSRGMVYSPNGLTDRIRF